MINLKPESCNVYIDFATWMPDYETANLFLGLLQDSQINIQLAQARKFKLLSSRKIVKLENDVVEKGAPSDLRNWTHYVALVCIVSCSLNEGLEFYVVCFLLLD